MNGLNECEECRLSRHRMCKGVPCECPRCSAPGGHADPNASSCEHCRRVKAGTMSACPFHFEQREMAVLGMTAAQVVVKLWNSGKTVEEIARHLQHRYDAPLARMVQGYIELMQGAEEFPGFPIMRKDPVSFPDEGGAA